MLPLRASVDWERGQWSVSPLFPMLLHYWNLTIRLFNVISWILVGVLPLCRDAVGVFYRPSRLVKWERERERGYWEWEREKKRILDRYYCEFHRYGITWYYIVLLSLFRFIFFLSIRTATTVAVFVFAFFLTFLLLSFFAFIFYVCVCVCVCVS